MREYLKRDLVKIKKYFYVLRPLLACEWIKNCDSIPPMEFEILLNSQIQDTELKDEIISLLQRKKVGEELNLEPKIEIINSYLEEKINFFKEYTEDIDKQNIKDTEILDNLFRYFLGLSWNTMGI